MKRENLLLAPVVNGKALLTIVAEMTFQTISGAFFLGFETSALRTSRMALCSVFLGVDMFNSGNVAITSYKIPFSGTRNGTLSGLSSHLF